MATRARGIKGSSAVRCFLYNGGPVIADQRTQSTVSRVLHVTRRVAESVYADLAYGILQETKI
jgi:hypothetical protein